MKFARCVYWADRNHLPHPKVHSLKVRAMKQRNTESAAQNTLAILKPSPNKNSCLMKPYQQTLSFVSP